MVSHKTGSKLIFSLGDQSYEAVLKDLPEYVISGSEVNIGGTTYTLDEGLKAACRQLPTLILQDRKLDGSLWASVKIPVDLN
jgi:hypothetical protein